MPQFDDPIVLLNKSCLLRLGGKLVTELELNRRDESLFNSASVKLGEELLAT